MSSKNYEKEKRSGNDVNNKKKKHKHKNHDKDDDEIVPSKSNKLKQVSNDTVKSIKTTKSIKHYKSSDSENEIKIKNAKISKKDKKQKYTGDTELLKSKIEPSTRKITMLSSSECDSDSVDIRYNAKNSVKVDNNVGGKASVQKSSKVKQQIYSSSEDEVVNEVKPSLSPKKTESTDNYFDGWSKEDVTQLISKMSAALPKNDTLKYVSRVEKLNWEQVAFGQYTPAECKVRWKIIEKKIRGYRILQEVLADAKIWVEQPWTDFYRGGKKKNRHPDMPKKPLTSYMIFYMKKKEKIIKENPGIALTTLSKIIAEKFNKLSPKRKAKYNKLANAKRAKYQVDMQKFFNDHPGEVEKIINASKNKKGPNIGMPGPAKPIPPLKLFLEDKIKQHKDEKDFNQALLIQQCKEKWKSMSSKKKMPWIRWAHEAEMKYLEELKAYQAENPSFEMPKLKSVLSKEEKKVLQRMEGKPEKPPGSAYGLFSKLMLKDPDLRSKYSTPKERMQEIAKMWKVVPKLDKDGYSEQVKHLLEKYKLEYASYLESLPEDKREEELASNLPKRKAKTVDKPAEVTHKKLKSEKVTPVKKVNDNEKIILEELLAKEPKAPRLSLFELYEEDMKNKGVSSKKIKKTWEEANESTKHKYELKLESLRQKYIVEYKNFLTNLRPEELRAYSEWKVKNKTKAPGTESQESEGSSDDNDDDEEEEEEQEEDDDEEEEEAKETKEEVNKKVENSSSSSSSASSSASSSSRSSSASSSSSSSSEEEDEDSEPLFL